MLRSSGARSTPLLLALVLCVVSTVWAAREVPRGWTVTSTAPVRDGTLVATIALRQRNLAKLEVRCPEPLAPEQPPTLALSVLLVSRLQAKFWSVSDPMSPQYGHFLGRDEVNALVAPSQQTRTIVEHWLREFDIDYEVATSPDFLVARIPIAVASRMFRATFYRFHNAASGTFPCA